VSTESTPETAATELAARLGGRVYGAVRVHEAAAQVITDVDGRPAVELRLRLGDPDGTAWPAEDLAALRRDVRAEAGPLMVYVWLRPSTVERADTGTSDAA
jgi:hypothetical protein